MNSNNNGIPILYYHSIADHPKESQWSFLSIGIKLFKKQINYLKKKGYYACNWDELYGHIQGVKQLPEKTVMFHFDDGFLDNWSVVFPIMENANFKYSIVVTPDFIQEGEVRPFVTQTNEDNKKDWWGYLNKKEMKLMSESGLVDFQAHGFTHTWYESSDSLIDVNDGNTFYPHLLWNNSPEIKPYWLTKPISIAFGFPIFEFKKSLELDKRFIVNDIFVEEAINLFDTKKSKGENLLEIQRLRDEYIKRNALGRYESKEESHSRLMKELKGARLFIENIINKPVEYVVFPGGGNSEKVKELAREAGYKLISKGTRPNAFNSKIYQVERYSAAYGFPAIFFNELNLLFLKLQLARANGNKLVNQVFKIIKQ
ncbi:polysaccharide deacetylase family protein [Xanthomarina gelatinilytica]|uniref:polysaccharide deacetylase family protein n=1 Tax=Xanthomarina gelatinilytica TaxID=1137281 RepID=UPI003AA83F02